MIEKLALIFAFVIVGSPVFAGEWTGEGKILEIYPSSTNNGILIKHEFMKNPDSCTPGTYLVLDKNQMFFSEIFSLLVATQARNAKISLYVSGCADANGASPSINLAITK